jgi:hypothetical protein
MAHFADRSNHLYPNKKKWFPLIFHAFVFGRDLVKCLTKIHPNNRYPLVQYCFTEKDVQMGKGKRGGEKPSAYFPQLFLAQSSAAPRTQTSLSFACFPLLRRTDGRTRSSERLPLVPTDRSIPFLIHYPCILLCARSQSTSFYMDFFVPPESSGRNWHDLRQDRGNR